MALPSCEVEYVVTSYAACQTTCIEMLLKELKIMKHRIMKLFIDNKSAVDLANHPVCPGRSKHIERTYHFLKDQVNKGKIVLKHCKSGWKLEHCMYQDEKSREHELGSVLEVVIRCFIES